jgi:hypothetical protein
MGLAFSEMTVSLTATEVVTESNDMKLRFRPAGCCPLPSLNGYGFKVSIQSSWPVYDYMERSDRVVSYHDGTLQLVFADVNGSAGVLKFPSGTSMSYKLSISDARTCVERYLSTLGPWYVSAAEQRRQINEMGNSQIFALSILYVDISVSLLLQSLSRKLQRDAQRQLDLEECLHWERESVEEGTRTQIRWRDETLS